MRESLYKEFQEIYILDLHGSSKPKEIVPSGYKNENIFDITKGVCITLMIKAPNLGSRIFLYDKWGTRQEKYGFSADSVKRSVPWKRVHPFAPFYMFRRLNRRLWREYKTGWSISDVLSPPGEENEIFTVGSLGFQTHRDGLAISFDRAGTEELLRDISKVPFSKSSFAEKYQLKIDDPWIDYASRMAVMEKPSQPSKVAYRPFDERWAEHGAITMDRPRPDLVKHITNGQTIGLLVPRQIGGGLWRHSAISELAAESCFIDNDSASQNSEFPLRLSGGQENLSPNFRAFLDAHYAYHYTPEEILGYVYAVLNAPTYRSRFAEFLRIDFPRIPFPETKLAFDRLSDLGWALLQAHLLKVVPKPTLRLGRYSGRGDHAVEQVRWSPAEQAIWINTAQHFAPVPKAVWEFHIGGYQVLDKYLKSRNARTLSLDEIEHVGKVAESLAFTLDQMAEIDLAYRMIFSVGDKATAPLATSA